MPNIIVNNYCNQKCEYCFAEANMNNPLLKKQMSLSLYIRILKFLKKHKEELRILGGEPLLHPQIHTFLQLAMKGDFPTILFSNINMPNKKIHEIFEGISGLEQLRINCNINHPDFYTKEEWNGIKENISYLKNKGVKIILGHNIYTLEKPADPVFQLALEHEIESINLKITNSSIGEKLIIDTRDGKLGRYIFQLLELYSGDFFIEISCGLDAGIFTERERDFIENETSIKLKFGCEGNVGKFDINTDGKLFKCFPLEKIYRNNPTSIQDCFLKKMSIGKIIDYLYVFYNIKPGNGECIAHTIFKS